jgi:hypothetical protein
MKINSVSAAYFPELQFQLVMSGAAAKMSALSIEVPNDTFDTNDHSTVRFVMVVDKRKFYTSSIAAEKLKRLQ